MRNSSSKHVVIVAVLLLFGLGQNVNADNEIDSLRKENAELKQKVAKYQVELLTLRLKLSEAEKRILKLNHRAQMRAWGCNL